MPLGQDAKAAEEGARGTGAFIAERHGIVVTATGLLFVAGSDGKLRAYEADTGNILWTASLPAGSEGIPAMYEANGRQYLVVPSSSRISAGGGHEGDGARPSQERSNWYPSYIAFALPEPSTTR